MKNKTVIVTGGSSGIGAVTALMFAKEGANVVITYNKNKAGAEETKNKMENLGAKALVVQADLIIENEAKNVVDMAVKEFGKIDVLVNNAGRYIDGDEWNGTADIWTKSLQQNLVSVMNVSKYAIEVFQKQKSGVIVSVASTCGINSQYDAISYSAAKAGVINITQAYAKLLSPLGGRANAVSPSSTKAGYWLTAPKEEIEATLANKPSHKFVEPETVAQKILFLASAEAKDITGKNFPVTE